MQIIFLSIQQNICFGWSKEQKSKVLSSTHNIYFGWEIKEYLIPLSQDIFAF